MAHTVTTPPFGEPLTLAQTKEYLRVETDEDDPLIETLITAARQTVETYLDVKLLTQTITEYWDEFPERGCFYLTFAPVQSITSVGYVDGDGNDQTWNSANYRTDTVSVPARLSAAYSKSYPTTRNVTNAVNVVYKVGYGGRDSVPKPFIQAMLMMIHKWYDNREDSIKKMPTAAEHLLTNYKTNPL